MMCLPLLSERCIHESTPKAAGKEELQMTKASETQQQPSAAGSSYFGKRLIFFGAAENKTEPALLQLFSKHGEVSHMFIVRSALGISSGCGHVTFAAAEQAAAALKALHGSTECAEAGATLGLLLVNDSPSSANSSSSGAAGDTARSSDNGSIRADGSGTGVHTQQEKLGKSVFFTKVPPTVTQNQLIQLFTACGEVAHLELFIPWPGAKISRGCGLVEFTSSSAAAAAVHSMHQQFTWPHSHSALVVEWVDRNRQSANNAKKARACAANGVGMTGSPGSMPVSNSLRADHQAAAAAGFWRPAHAGAGPMGFAGASSMPQAQLLQLQQQAGAGRNSHSCPLPQLPPGWQVVGTAQQLPPAGRVARPAGIAGQWAAVPTSLGAMPGPRPQQASMGAATYLQQPAQLQHGDNSALVLQQQMLQQQQTQRMGVCGSDAGSAGTWMACPATSTLSSPSMDLSSLASLGSVYDASVLSGSTYSSTVNSAANSGALQSQLGAAWDKQQQAKVLDLTAQNASACSAGPNANTPLGSIPFSKPMMAATAAAMSGNSSDAIWQQLLQQNVMLFQTMTPPPEEEAVGQHMLLPSSAGQQQASLQAAGMVANTSRGMNSGMLAYLPMQSQAQQLSNGSVMYTGSAMQPAQQTRQQIWWLQQGQAQQQQQQQAQQSAQQQQAQAGETSAVVALPLSQRQLAAMAGVLPEVPTLTGAQAWISSAATGGLQLCLSGTYTQLQAGHTAVAMLLGKAGIDEPLAPAVVHAGAS